VKRLLPCVILALAFHAIILSADFSWLRLTPGLTPAAKSLTITLSAARPQKPRAQATAPNKLSERPLEHSLKKEPRENPAATPTLAPVAPQKNIVKKARPKKSLKALTFKKQQIKTIEATQAESRPKPLVALKAETQIFTTASSEPKPLRQPLPADAAFIKKTHRVPAGSSEPAATAAILPDSQRDDTLSGKALKLARPLYKQNTAPPYPRKARRLGYEGIVMLKVLIDESGRVDDLMVLQSSGHPVLDRAAASAVRKWLFEPGTEGGIKKKMWVKIPVRFDLK
jgi:protein TonB